MYITENGEVVGFFPVVLGSGCFLFDFVTRSGEREGKDEKYDEMRGGVVEAPSEMIYLRGSIYDKLLSLFRVEGGVQTFCPRASVLPLIPEGLSRP